MHQRGSDSDPSIAEVKLNEPLSEYMEYQTDIRRMGTSTTTTHFPTHDAEWSERVIIREETNWYVAFVSRIGGIRENN